MTPDGTLSYADRLFLASLRHPLSKPVAQRAVQKAARVLADVTQILGARFDKLPSSPTAKAARAALPPLP